MPVGHGVASCARCAGRSSTPTRTHACARYQALAHAGRRRRARARRRPDGGWYVGPTVVVTDDPRPRVATDEIFGPVLTVLRADDFDHALALANDTDYALTGRRLLALAVADRRTPSRAPRGQRLREPGDHRRARRPSAVRRATGCRASARRPAAPTTCCSSSSPASSPRTPPARASRRRRTRERSGAAGADGHPHAAATSSMTTATASDGADRRTAQLVPSSTAPVPRGRDRPAPNDAGDRAAGRVIGCRRTGSRRADRRSCIEGTGPPLRAGLGGEHEQRAQSIGGESRGTRVDDGVRTSWRWTTSPLYTRSTSNTSG